MSYLRPSGKCLRQLCHRRFDPLRGIERIRSRQLEHAEAHGRIFVEIGVEAVVERRKLHARDILQPHHGGADLLHDDLGKLCRIGEAALRLHRDLESAGLVDRRLVENAGRDLHVLPLQRRGDVVRRQRQRLQPVRIEPDPHRVISAAEHRDRAHALRCGSTRRRR